MTIQEALHRTQGTDAGFVNRRSVRYAETLLLQEEAPFAAVIANITTARDRFPGVVVLTDRRVLAVCGLPGIKRATVCGSGWTCREDPSAIRHKFTFSDGKGGFSMTVDPETGERFARQIALLNGEAEAFDAAGEGPEGGILNPVLLRSKRRVRQAKKKCAVEADAPQRDQRMPVQSGPKMEPVDAQAEAQRLARQLDAARAKGHVADTDPRAVAARLAAELAESSGENAAL